MFTCTTAVPPTIVADIALPVKFIDVAYPCKIPSSKIGNAIDAVMFVNLLPSPTNPLAETNDDAEIDVNELG